MTLTHFPVESFVFGIPLLLSACDCNASQLLHGTLEILLPYHLVTADFSRQNIDMTSTADGSVLKLLMHYLLLQIYNVIERNNSF